MDLEKFIHYLHWVGGLQASRPPGALRWSRLAWLATAAFLARESTQRDPERPRVTPEEFRGLLDEMDRTLEARGIELLVLIWPLPLNIEFDESSRFATPFQFETFKFGRDTRRAADGLHRAVDLIPVARRLALDHPTEEIFLDHIHGTALLNAEMARSIAARLVPILRARKSL